MLAMWLSVVLLMEALVRSLAHVSDSARLSMEARAVPLVGVVLVPEACNVFAGELLQTVVQGSNHPKNSVASDCAVTLLVVHQSLVTVSRCLATRVLGFTIDARRRSRHPRSCDFSRCYAILVSFKGGSEGQ